LLLEPDDPLDPLLLSLDPLGELEPLLLPELLDDSDPELTL
jgi:hypothetical protein